MQEVIFSCRYGSAVEGLVAVDGSFTQKSVFVDSVENLVGFRRQLRTFTNSAGREFIEIGYFMEMLYEGSVEGFLILTTPTDYVDFCRYDFDILKNNMEHLVSRRLISSLVRDSDLHFQNLGDVTKEVGAIKDKGNFNFTAEILEYNKHNAYICLRNLLLAKEVLQFSNFDITKLNTPLLQGVKDGRFSLKAITEARDEYLSDIDSLEEVSDLLNVPDLDRMNEILMEIRNIEITYLNVEQ